MKAFLVIIILLILLLICFILNHKTENLEPWKITACKLKCQERGQQMPWDGGPDGPWDDPATEESATFDVAGCMQRCEFPN